MGMSQGNVPFDLVARELLAVGCDDATVTRVCDALIKGLQELDWDTEYESFLKFADRPAIVEAFRRNGVYAPCQRGAFCALEDGHGGDCDS